MAAAASNAFAKSVGARASSAASNHMSKLSDKAQGKKIDWTDFNWPSRCEPFNLLHLPAWETLKSYSQGVYLTVRVLYTAYLVTIGVTTFNLLNCVILSCKQIISDCPGVLSSSQLLRSYARQQLRWRKHRVLYTQYHYSWRNWCCQLVQRYSAATTYTPLRVDKMFPQACLAWPSTATEHS